jgi:hypothetical protein
MKNYKYILVYALNSGKVLVGKYVLPSLFLVLFYFLFLAIYSYMPELSLLPYGVAKALTGVIMLKLVDEFMLPEVKTMQILKDDAVGYAIYLLPYGIIIAWAIGA